MSTLLTSSYLDAEIRYRNAITAYLGWLGASVGHVLDTIGPYDNLFELIEETQGDLTLCFRGAVEERQLRRVFREYELVREALIESIVASDLRVQELEHEILDYGVVAPHPLIDELDELAGDITEQSLDKEREYMTLELARLLAI